MFGWSLIKTEELRAMQIKEIKLNEVHRWFSGWKDLEIIWDYIYNDTFYGISRTREEYAKARNTDEYGR